MKHKSVEQLETDIRRMRLHLDRANINATYREMEARRYREKLYKVIKDMKALNQTPEAASAVQHLEGFMRDQEILIDEMYQLLSDAARRASRRRKAARRRAEVRAR